MSDRLRILLLVEGYNAVAGIPELADNLAAELQRMGHEAAVASSVDRRPETRARERQPRTGVACTYLKIPSRRPVTLRHPERLVRNLWQTRYGELIRFMRNWRPDVVSSQLYGWDRFPPVMKICRTLGVPLVQSFLVTDTRGRGKSGDAALKSIAGARAFVAGSAATREFFADLLPEARSARVIIGGCDVEAMDAAPAHHAERPYILSAGRLLLKHKAFDLLIESFAPLAAEFPEVDLLIAGSGEDRARIDSLIAERRLANRVTMLGPVARDELCSYYKGALFFALSSRPGECLPLVFLEAMAAGIPVVATETGGAAEVIRHGASGFVTREGDSAAMAQAMRELLGDPEKRQAMGALGHRLAAGKYSWKVYASRYIELFRECIGTQDAMRLSSGSSMATTQGISRPA